MNETSQIAIRRNRRPIRQPELDQGVLPGLLGHNLRRAQLAVFQSFQNVIAPFNITPGQFGLLILINENPGLSQSELGNAMSIDRSTMVAVVDRLESRKLVSREGSPYDRRSYALKLTQQGQNLIDKLVPLVQKHEESVTKNLSKDEISKLINMLERISAHAR